MNITAFWFYNSMCKFLKYLRIIQKINREAVWYFKCSQRSRECFCPRRNIPLMRYYAMLFGSN